MKNNAAFIPMTLILTKDIPERFETTYATTFTEVVEYSTFSSLSWGRRASATERDFIECARNLNILNSGDQLFKIYHPSAETVFMLNISDAEKPKATINTVQKLDKLHAFREVIGALHTMKGMIGSYEKYTSLICNFWLSENVCDAQPEVSAMQNRVVASNEAIDVITAALRRRFLSAFIE